MCRVTEPSIADRANKDYRRSTIFFAVLVVAALVLKALLLSFFPIHDDEFHFLSQVYAYERGEPQPVFQTFHVHFFGWLTSIGGNEVTQVMVARGVMYLFLLGTCFYLFRMARHFLGVRAALFSVLSYLGFLSTIANGASFRSDTPAILFIMFALYHFIIQEDSVFSNVVAGIAMAVSLLFTIKAAIFLPVFAVWFLSTLLWRRGGGRFLIHTGGFAGALMLAAITLYKLHTAMLPHSVGGRNTGFLAGAFSTFVTFSQIFPARVWIVQTLMMDCLIWLILLGGLIAHWADLWRHRYRGDEPKALLLVLAVPLLSLLVYRNAYPYFLVFLMPTATLFCGYAFESLASILRNAKRITVPVLSVVLGLMVFLNFIVHFPRYIISEAKRTSLQQEVLAAIHRMFPEPVPYVDTCSMVSSFPKVGLFISPAGIRSYHRRAEPMMAGVLSKQKPLFLLVNYPSLLDLNLHQSPRMFGGEGLLDEDWSALRSYFIRHWGPIWVAGKQLDLGPGAELQHFDIIAPGPYTVESKTDISIDGTSYRDGSIVRLAKGSHTVAAGGASTTIRLRWGDHLYRPDVEPEETYLGAPHY